MNPNVSCQLLEGKGLAKKIQESIREQIQKIQSEGRPIPKLAALQVGDNPSSAWYVGQQEKLAGKLGIMFEKWGAEKHPTQEALLKSLRKANQDSSITGIFITMPLPEGFESDAVLLTLDPKKDVEGMHPANLGLIVLRKSKLIPSTAYAAFELIQSTGTALRGKKAAIVGQSAVVGRPLNLLLGEKRVTTTVCNTGTSEADLKQSVSEADIVVACAGQPGLVRGEWVKPGALVIDVGTTEVEGKLAGDVDFEGAKSRAGYLTPVPGGVGPLTVTMLMQNVMNAYQWQNS